MGQSRFQNKVAFITGVARGQGRSHALRLAAEGAAIIGVDIAKPMTQLNYELSTEADLDETRTLLEATGSRVILGAVDVRDYEAMKAFVDSAVSELGRLDIVVANAGIADPPTQTHDITTEIWQRMIDVNLTGVWNTTRVAIPHMIVGGNGGSIVLTGSAASLQAYSGIGSYVVAKHGVVGLMKTLANELGQHRIRVNCVLPTQVDTPMIMNEGIYQLFVPDQENPGRDAFAESSQAMHVLPTPWLEAADVSNAVLWLSSDEARFVTGVPLPIDAGVLVKK